MVATLGVFRNLDVRGMLLSGHVLIVCEDVPPSLVKIAALIILVLLCLKVV